MGLFLFATHLDWLWGPPNFLSSEYGGGFDPRGKASGAWSWTLASIKCWA